MNKVLRKRFPREIRANLFRYLSLFLMIALCMYIIIAIVDAAEIIIQGTAANQQASDLEDGEVTVFTPLLAEQIRQIEAAGVTIESHVSYDVTLEDGSILRIFVNREKIDRVVLDDGRMAQQSNEVVLEKRYCAEHDIVCGDIIRIGGREFTVTGVGSAVDYDAPYRKLSDTAIDSKLFGIAFVTGEAYDAIKAETVVGSEDLTYAFLLNDAMSADELKEMIKDFKFDYKQVEDPYYQELLEDSYGKKDEITDGINELVDGVDELFDGVGELRDGTGELRDGMKELYDGGKELYDGTADLKKGTKELTDGVQELQDGAQELHDGTGELLDGTSEFRDGLSTLADGASKLDDALDELEDNNDAITGGAGQILGGMLATAQDTLNAQIVPLGLPAVTLNRENYAEVLEQVAAKLEAAGGDASAIRSLRASLDGIVLYEKGTDAYTDAVGKISSGAYKVAVGAEEAKDSAGELHDGAVELHDGTAELVDGVGELHDGAKELDDGAKELYDGAGELHDGLREAYDGSVELDDGAAELYDGVEELRDGVKELKEQSDEMMEKIFAEAPDNITSFMLREDNLRIGGAAGDIMINKLVGMVAGVIVLVLFTYVLSVFVIHQIQNESSVIGALYALGVKKKDLMAHYITLPTLIAFAGGTIGALFGMSGLGSTWQMADSYEYYSLPWFDPIIPAYLIIYAVVMPPLVSLVVNYLVINKSLSRTALSLIKNEQKVSRGKDIPLGNIPFMRKYKIRQMLRERRTAFTVIAGMVISLFIFMMGLDCYVLCESVGRLSKVDTRYEYMYTYKYPTKEVPKGGEACFVETLKKEQYGYTLDVTIMGIDDDNPYIPVQTVKGKNKIVASDSVAGRYGVKKGDKIIFSDNAADIDYAFTVADIVPYSIGLTVFMDIDSMRELFGEDDDYYNVVMSSEALQIEEGRLYGVATRADVEKSSGIFTELMAPMVTVLIVVSVIIFCIVMYLMTAVMIDRAGAGISLLKIFGYRTGEIRKMYLDGNRFVIMVGALFSIPVSKLLMDAMFPSFVANVACPIHLEFKWYYYVLLFVAIMGCYSLISLVLTRKLNRFSPAQVLKNRE
ncbi:MAG: ABC transporter permease [Lachnospiraceae bacterium]|nr:ABC transporter permease [Lachnospiraceae bacterium]